MKITVEHKLNEEQEEKVEARIKELYEYADSRVDDIRDYSMDAIEALERKVLWAAGTGAVLGFLTGVIVGHLTKETYDD